MSDEQKYNTPKNQTYNLPNATISLVLGIISIVTICLGVGIICGIIGLLLADKDRKLYWSTPELYSSSSYSTSNAGRTCSIIGLVIASILFMFFCILIIWNYIHAGRKVI